MASGPKGTVTNFLHLFERISEPMGVGVRGSTGARTYFYYEDPKMLDEMVRYDPLKASMKMTSQMVRQMKGVRMVGIGRPPKKMPNLDLINELCPKTTNFSYFLPAHKKALAILKNEFMNAENPDKLFELACACRDSPKMNCELFVFALCSCLAARRDTRHFRIPAHYEIMPSNYCDTDMVREAHKMAHIPEMPSSEKKDRKVIGNANFTGRGKDPEQKLWYFREDILVNSHHFHWHVVFPTCSPKDPKAEGYRDRRGELFYYMHHSMIARYDTERLCNGLTRTRKFNFKNLVLEEGYFGKLSSENSNQQWGTRQAFTRLTDVQRNKEDMLAIKVEELERWRDRILETIDLGYYVKKDAKGGKDMRVPLEDNSGIDVLGNIIESSSTLTPHPQYYGAIGFHNMGHVLIAFSHDPGAKFNENIGVMGSVASAMRDPAFYRWHKYIDYLFDTYKKTLPPYPLKGDRKSFPLVWDNIEVVPGSIYLQEQGSSQRNILKTFWDVKDIDLGRGLDFQREMSTGMDKSRIMGSFMHLSHSRFDYFFDINNKTGRQVQATIRIFMAPKRDENKDVFKLDEQRLLFFEMDKVSKTLRPGSNTISISSADSSVTLRDENGSSFQQIETLYKEAKTMNDRLNESQCSCGWPQHLLLPRGSPGLGEEYDVFIIVTDGEQDNTSVDKKGCKSALSFCGILNEKYPDSRPMGYPFDRTPYLIDNPNKEVECPEDKIAVSTLEKYVEGIKNSGTVTVKIVHEDVLKMKNPEQMEEQFMGSDGRCIKFKELKKVSPSPNRGDFNTRPVGRPQGNRFPERDDPYGQYQWGGVTSRSSREPDDDWEHLREEWY